MVFDRFHALQDAMMEFTEERSVRQLHDPVISDEHWHRYQFASLFVKNKSVLDISCGEGYGSDFLSQSAKAVVGVDVSGESIQRASRRYVRDNLTFLVGQAGAIPIEEDHSFDVIVSFEAIELIDEVEQRGVLTEVKRLLSPKGVFIISTPRGLVCSDAPHFKTEHHLEESQNSEFGEYLGGSFRTSLCWAKRLPPVRRSSI